MGIDILIDFDGTCVTHIYPRVGESIGAESVLIDLTKKGHRLILFTMRDGKTLEDAVKWFKDNGIPLYGIQKNPRQTWTTSPKAWGDLIIDDTNIFMPKTNVKGQLVCDWVAIRLELEKQGIL